MSYLPLSESEKLRFFWVPGTGLVTFSPRGSTTTLPLPFIFSTPSIHCISSGMDMLICVCLLIPYSVNIREKVYPFRRIYIQCVEGAENTKGRKRHRSVSIYLLLLFKTITVVTKLFQLANNSSTLNIEIV